MIQIDFLQCAGKAAEFQRAINYIDKEFGSEVLPSISGAVIRQITATSSGTAEDLRQRFTALGLVHKTDFFIHIIEDVPKKSQSLFLELI